MISKKLWAVFAVAIGAVALTVFNPGGGSVTQAKGPNTTAVVIGLGCTSANCATSSIPGTAGSAVATYVDLKIDNGGAAPSESAFFDTTVTSTTGSETPRGPGHPLGAGAAAVAATTGTITFQIQTNVMPSSGFVSVGTSPHFGTIAQCGDNYGATSTRDYNGAGGGIQTTVGPKTFKMYVGDMDGSDDILPLPDGFQGWDGIPAQENLYAHSGGRLIQTYDDDNNNGIPDSSTSDPGSPASKAEPAADGAATLAHPWATGNSPAPAEGYVASTPQTQHDNDADGIPNGIEFVPDFLPMLAENLGIHQYWNGRSMGLADVFPGIVAATDVHFMGFTDVPDPDGGLPINITFTVLGNPFSAPNPASQGTITCPPFTSTVALDATTTNTSLCVSTACTAGAPGVATGAPVSVISATGSHETSLFITDGDDYDNDGRVGGVELCARDTVNTDADGDLVSGVCDAVPGSWDNDGDTNAANADRETIQNLIDNAGCAATTCDNDVDNDNFINNVDNCETTSNIDQDDADGDGVGDACDPFENVAQSSGKGDGNGGFANTPDNLDNDLACGRSWSTGGSLTAGAATCNNVDDSNDDGVLDPDDTASDEDSDGASDACETNSSPSSNPLVPNSLPSKVTNPAGTATGTDADADHMADACEEDAGLAGDDPDFDNDGVQDGIEAGAGTNPAVANAAYLGSPAADTDGDGCNNLKEINAADNPIGGAQENPANDRHPGNWWDFYSVDSDNEVAYNPNNNIDLSDTVEILQHFGEGYNAGAYAGIYGQGYDRTRLLSPGPPGVLVEGNNGIDLSEALANLFQFGFGGAGCVAPGPVPAEGGGKF